MDDEYHWMSGYDGYYEAMQNRIGGASSINVKTPEGLQMLKNWLYNHLEDSEVGGVANFYTGLAYSLEILPSGTPEAGKHVFDIYGPEATHAMTIVGYNDSIRYDVNNDGQFTNDIDITGDGIVDMQDWEIGGLKFVNSYGPTWGDAGFAYMLYRTLAIKYGEGGIWNNSVHVIHPDTTAKPMLTIKSTINYNKRGRIRLRAGISTDTADYFPEHSMSFSIFNFQGGDYYMTGSSDPEGKSLELGLDITPLLSYVNNNEPFRIFLLVDENDPNSSGNGYVTNFSVISYENDAYANEFFAANMPVAIADNSTTISSVVVSKDFDPLSISHDEPVLLDQNHATTIQLQANGGTPPYTWQLKHVYHETTGLTNYDPQQGIPLTPSDNHDGFAAVAMPFSFPFYGQKYDTLYMHVNGYLMFDHQDMPYYYLLFDENYLRQVRAIAPLMNYTLGLYSNGDYISCVPAADSIVFKWRLTSNETDSTFTFAATLFPDGDIRFAYGNIPITNLLKPAIGLSDGIRASTVYSTQSGTFPQNESAINFHPSIIPAGLTISRLSVDQWFRHLNRCSGCFYSHSRNRDKLASQAY